MSVIYLDNNATTRVLPQVAEAMQPWLFEYYGNPSSSHSLGQQAKQALMQARADVASLLGASPAEIIFTSGATESNHMAILSGLASLPERRSIITSSVEHASTLQLLSQLSQQGINVVYIPVKDSGELADFVCSNTFLDYYEKQDILAALDPAMSFLACLISCFWLDLSPPPNRMIKRLPSCNK